MVSFASFNLTSSSDGNASLSNESPQAGAPGQRGISVVAGDLHLIEYSH